jgi:hypothetical protein
MEGMLLQINILVNFMLHVGTQPSVLAQMELGFSLLSIFYLKISQSLCDLMVLESCFLVGCIRKHLKAVVLFAFFRICLLSTDTVYVKFVL